MSRLRAAGAVFIGKTNLPELAIIGSTEGPAFGITRNPWDLDATPGGSSGGSAAAVAADWCPPPRRRTAPGRSASRAANCGLVGLKPQRDRIPLSPLTEHWYGMSALGFEARTVADSALLLDVGAGQDGRYAAAAARPPERLRVALSAKPPSPRARVAAGSSPGPGPGAWPGPRGGAPGAGGGGLVATVLSARAPHAGGVPPRCRPRSRARLQGTCRSAARAILSRCGLTPPSPRL